MVAAATTRARAKYQWIRSIGFDLAIEKVMPCFRERTAWATGLAGLVLATALLPGAPTRVAASIQAERKTAPDQSAKTWIGRSAEIEAYLRTAPIASRNRSTRSSSLAGSLDR